MICVLLLLVAFVGGVYCSPTLRSFCVRYFPPRQPPSGGAGNG